MRRVPGAAPRDAAGLAHWARANLFPSPTAAVATILASLAGLWLAGAALQWLVLDAYWAGSEPAACPDKGAVCWPFIRARYTQFLYGFYPLEQRWRIDASVVGLVVLVPALRALSRRVSLDRLVALILLALLLVLAVCRGGWAGLEPVPTARWGGAFLSTIAVATVFALAFPLGVLLALGRNSRLPLLRTSCALWIEFWRGVPALVVLFMATIMFPLFMPEGVNIDKLVRALAAMTVLMSSYLAEAIRGGLASVPAGQVEAATALGIGYWRRTVLVVLPQALAAAVPQITSNLIGLTKETTVLLVIGIPDLLGMVNAAAADPAWLSDGVVATGYVFAAIVFWIACFGLSRLGARLETRLRAGQGTS
jgi:general L-amino acid transport system permease protein